jgi:C4-type Zn-finger protein
MAKTCTEKITNIETEIQQLENKRKQLIQAQKKEERNARTKRLCKRMGLFESMLPDTVITEMYTRVAVLSSSLLAAPNV